VWYGPRILVDEADAETMKENDIVTFMDWGNVKINKINRDANNKITGVQAELNLENKDYKKTLKVTWLVDSPQNAPFTPIKCYHFDHIISKAVLDKDEDFKLYCEHQTEVSLTINQF
jgi:bifunctional glutamyl/prolyl-tRNA synthetase